MRLKLLVITLLCVAANAYAVRIKDITSIAGVRENQLVGYGLVVGLDGTGDHSGQAAFTLQAFKNMLVQFGIKIPTGTQLELKNVAAVAVSANLPAFAKPGQKLDVTVSSLGNATSLRGGELLMTALRGADDNVYAIAQGSVIVSGFGAHGSDGSKVTVNSRSTGRIPNGASIEDSVPTNFVRNGIVTFELNQPDFSTAEMIAKAINRKFGRRIARPIDPSAVAVHLTRLIPRQRIRARGPRGRIRSPADYKDERMGPVPFGKKMTPGDFIPYISRIENINMLTPKTRAKIIVNSRTGTIVVDQNITIAPVAVAHGNLSVVVSERPFVSQPEALSSGQTVSKNASEITINQSDNRAFLFSSGSSLQDFVDQVNRVGAAPGDLIAILEAIKKAGALQADLEVI